MGPISHRIGYQGETHINSVEVHPQLSNNRHPVAGAHLCVLVQCGPGPDAFVTATLIPECLKHLWNKTPTPITFIGAVKHVPGYQSDK